ncbi:biopolymer transporter ExbD [uncultured Ferrimonas sp.]|uniref:ExbD/TolR family protein n=1 Tax=uncultured Ferrimonas sp. TaxID=432640 RepID=UPI002625D743|nr:biopolymer transporter ExbD [uncultured Ferrimonas sp.]
MKQSARAKRLGKHHARLKQASKLNLVALMDIFTILVFFLIVNQSEVRVLQNIDQLALPISVAEKLPVDNLVVTVLPQTVLVQERAVWQGDQQSLQHNDDFVTALQNELNYHANKRPELTETEQQKGRGITIIGDASTPYVVLKQIMAACAQSGYRDMSLAVEQRSRAAGEG